MDYEQADKILETFNEKPTNRGDQIKLIRILGYNRLRNKGNRRLEDCDDNQIHAVARTYHQRAIKMINNYWADIFKQELEQNHHSYLCDLFMIPEEQREQTPLDELERLLD